MVATAGGRQGDQGDPQARVGQVICRDPGMADYAVQQSSV